MEKSNIYQKVSDYIDLNYESNETKKLYKSYSKRFIFGKHPDSIEKLTDNYLTKILVIIKQRKSLSVYNQYVSVLKIIYQKVLNQRKLKDIKCVKQFPKLKVLPDVRIVFNQINNIRNLKHQTILMTALKTGLRVSELLNVEILDIDRVNMKILIRQSKGGNSEFVILSYDLLQLIEYYISIYKPKKYLFEGQNEKYSKTSVNKIVKKYIGKQYSIHTLRHLAITYIINKGYSLPKAKLFSRHKSDSAIHFYYHYDKSVYNELRTEIDNISA